MANGERAVFFEKLTLLIFFVFFLNMLDGILTIVLVCTGKGVETNPLMLNLINTHPALFMSCKVVLVFLGSMILWRYRERMFAVFSIFLAFVTYYVILLYEVRLIHLGFIDRVLN